MVRDFYIQFTFSYPNSSKVAVQPRTLAAPPARTLSTMLIGTYASLHHEVSQTNVIRCTNGNAGKGSYTIKVTYDKAATNPMYVAPNKSLVGVGTKGVIRGRGLYLQNTKNVIIQ